jgi:hypothetical protein
MSFMSIFSIFLTLHVLDIIATFVAPDIPKLCCDSNDSLCGQAPGWSMCPSNGFMSINQTQTNVITTTLGYVVEPFKRIYNYSLTQPSSGYYDIVAGPNCVPLDCENDFPATLSLSDYYGYSPSCNCTLQTFYLVSTVVSAPGMEDQLVTNVTTETLDSVCLSSTKTGIFGMGLAAPINPGQGNNNQFSRRANVGPTCTINYRMLWPQFPNVTIFMNNPPDHDWVVFARKEEFDYNYICNGAICYLEFPPDMFQTQGFLYLDVIFVPNICNSLVIPINGMTLCRPSECTWSCPGEMIKYYHCLPQGLKASIWIVFALIIFLVIFAFPAFVLFIVYEALRHTLNCPWYIYDAGAVLMVSPIVQNTGSLISKTFVVAKYQFTGEKAEETTHSLDEFTKKRKTKKTAAEIQKKFDEDLESVSPRKQKIGWFKMFLILLGVSSAGAVIDIPSDVTCSVSTPVVGSFTSCVTTGQIETCLTSLTASLTIGIGKTSCLSIMDKDGNHKATAYIKYVANTASVSGSFQYETSDWSFTEMNLDFCPSTTNFKDCLAWAATNQPGSFYQGYPGYNDHPGFNFCIQHIAGAGTSIFTKVCDGKKWAYNTYRSSFRPTGHTYSVYSIPGITYTPILSVIIVDANQNEIFDKLIMGQGLATSSNGYQVQIDGSYFIPPTIFDTNYFVVDNTNGSLAYLPNSIAAKGSPKSGLGEIQAFTVGGLAALNTNAFVYDPKMLTCVASETTYHCSSQTQHGIPTMKNSAKILPALVSDNFWAYDGVSGLVSNITNTAPLSVTFSTIGDGLSIETYHKQVCPQIDVVNATGCFNCDEQAVLTIDVHSTCDGGYGFVSTDDPNIILGNQDIILTTDISQYHLRFRTNKQVNDFTVTVTDETGSIKDTATVHFIAFPRVYNDSGFNDGSLPSGIEGYDNKNYDSVGVDGLKHDMPNFFWDAFHGAATIGQTIAVVAIILVGIVVLIVGIRWLNTMVPKDYAKRNFRFWKNKEN